eukprot:TRINITY_DN13324_c0_g2_i3.p1 TRINITY_DN13324_c0_g2~~TRINITY_DN13324_c0_g2_i3.p1  ORF type:complete len:235 (+),score=43.42 TRINITY_DN13324_c0_g2_i3:65-769(+)
MCIRDRFKKVLERAFLNAPEIVNENAKAVDFQFKKELAGFSCVIDSSNKKITMSDATNPEIALINVNLSVQRQPLTWKLKIESTGSDGSVSIGVAEKTKVQQRGFFMEERTYMNPGTGYYLVCSQEEGQIFLNKNLFGEGFKDWITRHNLVGYPGSTTYAKWPQITEARLFEFMYDPWKQSLKITVGKEFIELSGLCCDPEDDGGIYPCIVFDYCEGARVAIVKQKIIRVACYS